ncbi:MULTISPECIES: helix-turn-helix transcriptional regulator [Yersinia]|uniref:LuxR family regulatory protein n=1 Tax=Yersinia intermedia TaxID=631 RepID=A0A0T9N431_YERIN|nr:MULTISPECIES: LuxR family transcriptional regulator [Yersinia]ARB86393.2 LuxR family transcriptional regulator [Yersinia sp. FDAARGOS_228]AVL36249.1 LuxR family transcriptional regulator [Yersinia intermedia]MCB5300299.1 LuxR C-terminal-related transcriptional regulator [Yersinia intermedia]MDN0117207.1 LuxR C-terminal-related transcriptional regulator [Yersinia intermedia]CNG74875.1 LuxR family regulatory protein [Yersinia intermedia]
MLSVAIITKNTFYKLGLISLLKKTFNKMSGKDYLLIDSYEKKGNKKANVIFEDFMVIVNIYQDNGFLDQETNDADKPILTINIPFNSDKLDIDDIVNKINKIIKVAKLDCCNMTSKDIIRFLGLKDNMQLSVTESRLVKLTSNGYSINDISTMLNRSEKTILSYRRSAIKKLGILNKLEFYNYASNMKDYGNNDAIFICI